MREINLLQSALKIKRNFQPNFGTEENKRIAKHFDNRYLYRLKNPHLHDNFI